jgi:hypothetical protein
LAAVGLNAHSSLAQCLSAPLSICIDGYLVEYSVAYAFSLIDDCLRVVHPSNPQSASRTGEKLRFMPV